MNKLNPEIIKKIEKANEYLQTLLPYSLLSDDELLQNLEKQATFERYFQLLADEVFDVNSSLAYQLGNKIPDSNKSTFYEVAELRLVETEFANRIAESAKTRNRLTHDYDKVQKIELIHEIKKFVPLYTEYLKTLSVKLIPHQTA